MAEYNEYPNHPPRPRRSTGTSRERIQPLPPLENQEATIDSDEQCLAITRAGAVLRWTVARWVAMLVEFDANPGGVAEIWRQVGIEEPSLQEYVRAAWDFRIEHDPELQAEVEGVTGRKWCHWQHLTRQKQDSAAPSDLCYSPPGPTEPVEADFLDETLPGDEHRVQSTDAQPPFMQTQVAKEPSPTPTTPTVTVPSYVDRQNETHSLPTPEERARTMTGWTLEQWADFNGLLRHSRDHESQVWQNWELPDPTWQEHVRTRWARRLAAEPALERHFECLVKRKVAVLRRLARG